MKKMASKCDFNFNFNYNVKISMYLSWFVAHKVVTASKFVHLKFNFVIESAKHNYFDSIRQMFQMLFDQDSNEFLSCVPERKIRKFSD